MENIIQKHREYVPDADSSKIKRAYELAEIAYHQQQRRSGIGWLEYSKQIAHKALDLKMDTTTVCAALLYHYNKVNITLDDIEKEVGMEVVKILESTQDLRGITDRYNNEHLSDTSVTDYLRRIILVVGKDLRTILLRLVDKLLSLDELDTLDNTQRELILSKALHLYAPLADLIGVYELKWQLEDKAFELLHPEKYSEISNNISAHPLSKAHYVKEVIHTIGEILKEGDNMKVHDVFGRTKKPYSYYLKSERYAKKYKLPFDDAAKRIKDVAAFTILVDSEEACYRALGLLHKILEPTEGEFDDYIKFPKPNGYRALQTTVKYDSQCEIEIHIKTPEMHHFNEYGPASHVLYKLYGGSHYKVTERKLSMLHNLLNWRSQLLDEGDSVDTSTASTEETILVFTPKGDVKELPIGATPVDFAYSVHTKIGDKAIMAKINGVAKPLNTLLKSGDVVEIITNNSRKGPSKDWLDFVKTSDARINIRRKSA